MASKEDRPKIKLQDTDTVKHLIIEFDLEKNRTKIMSAFGLWGNIRILASAIGVSYHKAIADGQNPAEAYKELESILVEMLDNQNYTFEETVIENGKKKQTRPTNRSGKTSKDRKGSKRRRKKSTRTKKADKSKPRANGNSKSKKKKSKKTGGSKKKGSK